MFMATNQFAIMKGCEKTFEVIWELTHDHLKNAQGFIRLRLERGPPKDGKSMYFVITMWENEADFLSWRCVELYGDGLRSFARRRHCSAELSGVDLDAAVTEENPQ